jgi:hypothetical protein
MLSRTQAANCESCSSGDMGVLYTSARGYVSKQVGSGRGSGGLWITFPSRFSGPQLHDCPNQTSCILWRLRRVAMLWYVFRDARRPLWPNLNI